MSYAYSQPQQQRIALPPGAIPIPLRPLGNYRNERLVAGPNPNAGFIRIRRPPHLSARQNNLNSLPPQNLAITEEAKPVTEDPESNEQQTLYPQFLNQQPQPQPPAQSHLPAILYSADENGEILNPQHRAIDFPGAQFSTTDRILPTTLRSTGAQRFALNPAPQQIPTPKPVSMKYISTLNTRLIFTLF